MKTFNPEKELKKIQHRNRNKIIFCVIALLIIIGISSSYALYQVRYSKRIIYTKVAPFSTSDLDLAIYVDGNPDKLPSKGTAFLDNVECDNKNNLLVYWDYENWILEIPKIEIPNKCKISFSTTESLINYLKYNSELVDDKTVDHNLRYVGANPNNYIWFNCDDYNNLTQETAASKCEKWRIMGLMNNITKTTGSKDNLIKIIRSTSVGSLAWDSAGKNNWATASLKTTLENYYNGTKINTIKGITTDTKKMIQSVQWTLGGHSTAIDILTAQWYTYERNEYASFVSQKIWDGYIGLMYPSDYGYATSGGSDLSREGCLAYQLYDWQTNPYKTNCLNNDWLYLKNAQWLLASRNEATTNVMRVDTDGHVTGNGAATGKYPVVPVLFLTSNVTIMSGNGSSATPYILAP